MTAQTVPHRLAVLLDFGAATPVSVLAAARGLADVLFLCDRELPYVRAHLGAVAALAPVCDITGLTVDEVLDRPECADLAGVVTFSEHQLNRAAALAHRRGLAFLSPAAARAVTDKFTQRRLLAEAGVQQTGCWTVRGAADLPAALGAVGLPAVLKPRQGAASARTCRVDSLPDAVERLRDLQRDAPVGTEFVVEQMLIGDPAVTGPGWADYVSVESVTVDGHLSHVEVTGKLPLAEPYRETGYVVPSTLDPPTRREVLALTAAALTALGVRHGATHVEVMLTRAGPRIIEVNGRVGGYVADLVRRARGFDLLRAALLAALGRACEVPAPVYRRHAFQYFLTPPVEAVTLRRLDGLDELNRQRGIQAVETFKRAGDRLDWREGTLTYLGIVHGSAADHEGVLRLVDMIHRTLRIEYGTAPEWPDG